MAKRVTLADIARRTGLSSATVSMALNASPGSRIPERTVRRVRAAAAELGYSPDVNARGLRTGRTEAIGFVSDEVTVTRFASAMIRGMLDTAAEHGFIVMMAEAEMGSPEQESAVRGLLGRRIDGLVFGQMRSRLLPSPKLDFPVPTIVVNGTAPDYPAVLPDEYAAGQAAVHHLVDRGHTKIALIGRRPGLVNSETSVTVAARMAGIDEAMKEAGLRFETEIEGSAWEPEFGYDGALGVFDSADVTALLVANDRVGFGAVQAAHARGLAVPEDVSIMSFDDEELATYIRPPLTTVRLPYQEMGQTGMKMLLDSIIDGTELGSETVYVPMPLIERDSVRDLRA